MIFVKKIQKVCKYRGKIKYIKLSTSGKLVISGEHAVMHGYSAISMAINQRMFVKITPFYENDDIEIKSNIFGKKKFKKGELQEDWSKQISFLVKTLSRSGLKINITSKIKNYGFGSSGALFTCIAFGLLKINDIANGKKNVKDEEYFFKILELYKKYNLLHNNNNDTFKPSGIDIATSFFGGIIYFSPTNYFVEKIKTDWIIQGITAIYTGKRTSITNVISVINENKYTDLIYKQIGDIVDELKIAIQKHNHKEIDDLIKKNQLLLQKLNLVDDDIEDILHQCERQNVVAKISGSGLGDCVIAFNGGIKIKGYKSIKIQPDNSGITYKMKYK